MFWRGSQTETGDMDVVREDMKVAGVWEDRGEGDTVETPEEFRF